MKKSLVAALLLFTMSPAIAMEFDANGNRLDPEPERQREYHWKDPRTGQTVIKPYPPANLKMRQTGRSEDGWITYLEVINNEPSESNLSAAVKGGVLSSNAQGGLRSSEVWLATEPERKAAEEVQRKYEATMRESKIQGELGQQVVDCAQQDYDNLIMLEIVKALSDPRVIVLNRSLQAWE